MSERIGMEKLIADSPPGVRGLDPTATVGFLKFNPHFKARQSQPYRFSGQHRVNLRLDEDWIPEDGGDLGLSNADITRSVLKTKPDTASRQLEGMVLVFGHRDPQPRRGDH